ncbi:alanine racemase [Helicobacter mustelae]|uniref:alanine racemase n=1 Tax=Helicobacter mustelae TaxID=217 RepID=UPI000DFC56BF|nr:alanine racemase [Helicobacter mustelae]STP13133.1 alanine racemase [Helicobacter mustelae]
MAQILIDSQKYKNNLDLITSHLHDKTKLAIVLKDNAYGHGLEEMAHLSHNYGIKSVFVKNESEARKIEHLFEHITIFYGIPSSPLPPNIHPVIHSNQNLDLLASPCSVELKINIGMNRNGIAPRELESMITKILQKDLGLFGVFAHNGYGDDLMEDFQNGQQIFQEIKEQTLYLSQKLGFPRPRFHSLNSSGTLRSREFPDDLVRIGMAAYGYCGANFPLEIADRLQPIASLWADKICTHYLPKGAKIGYSGMSVLQEDSFVSTYDIGYGDGLFRFDGTQPPYFSADGFLILPKTSMDCFSALSTKERICVFDDARTLAQIFHTIPYEILVRISPFIQRIIL